ncbi:LysR substrate-binding domain-containing protein [Pseudomonas aeruginosa]|uniref:LysR substrate-binding domain-containing protein n=1 Tax=Pseudomonas aeruginosa TaxID=287 RepID=UPI0037490D30
MRQPRLPGAATRAARPGGLRAARLAGLPAPFAEPENFWWMERDGARQRIDQPRPRLASDNYDFLLAHLLAGLGLQFCPQWSVAPLLGEGRLVRLLGDYHFDPGPFGPSIHVLYPGHRRNTRKVRAFLEHLRASLQRQGLCHRL